MKIAALYTRATLSLSRRVLFPYSVLAERGHSFSFLSVPTLSAGLSFGYDVTVLPDWVLSDEELGELEEAVAVGRTFVYDLADPRLVENAQVQKTLRLVRLVTVPNEYLQKEGRIVVSASTKVAITPSVVNPSYFAQARRERRLVTGNPVIGCFGPHDWSLVQKPLSAFLVAHDKAVVLADAETAQQLGEMPRVYQDALTPENYPALLHSCDFGLCPYEGNRGQETAWAYEYGMLGIPVIASAESPYSRSLSRDSAYLVSNTDPDRWLRVMEDWLHDERAFRVRGRYAFGLANIQRATEQASVYLNVMRKMLPHLR